ncbi:hypothetical protein NDU88_004781 [Pleurodeles waltl]|uniref:Uncharacterized protein n=1 Tax=Pleurodeles waltl TaxID=8319 RepID=A0AAV7TSD1_PLEWA|nr:hypothetical protein NDU88_004781 [Pleurodeles waltl]
MASEALFASVKKVIGVPGSVETQRLIADCRPGELAARLPTREEGGGTFTPVGVCALMFVWVLYIYKMILVRVK